MARITPARAGKTSIRSRTLPITRDHPRSCGKDIIPSKPSKLESGSPPLVRERRVNGAIIVQIVGITPARAGKTRYLLLPRTTKKDHPRSCGKDQPCGLSASMKLGSPPLVRERRDGSNKLSKVFRITPARAGKTECALSYDMRNKDHPRSCGKDFIKKVVGHVEIGSPPLVRERLY